MGQKSNSTLYLEIYNDLKEKILNNTYQPGDKLPTELELAKRYGVSRITSQRALTDLERDGFIHRQRGRGSFVLNRYSIEAASNVDNNIVSIILPSDNIHSGHMEYIQGASGVLNKNKYLLSVHNTNNDFYREKELLTTLPYEGINGIIYYPSFMENLHILYPLYLDGYPIVTIDSYISSIDLPAVISDNLSGGYEATKYLIELGHKRIAYVSNVYIHNISSVRDRFFGYCRALKDSSIPYNDDIVIFDLEYKNDAFSHDTFILLEELVVDKNVTAIVAEHDILAINIYRALESMGINIPNDISIIGFDNIELIDALGLPLTTVNQNFYEIGKKAGNMIINLIKLKNFDKLKNFVPVELVIRGTTAPPSN